MKVNVKKIDKTKRELSIEVSADIVKERFDDVYIKIAKEARIPGFRAGNAPRDMLEKHYSGVAREEVLKSLIPEIYDQAIDTEKLEVIDLPKISDVKLDKDTLFFTATVEVKPEINVKDYKGIKINYKDIEVTEEQVQRRLDSIKESRKIENIDDTLAKSLGYPEVSQLREALKAQIYIQKENEQRMGIEREIIQHLSEGADFHLPSSLIERQLKDMLSEGKVELALRGMSEDEIVKHEPKLNEQLKPQAQERVKIYLILEAVAKKENIPLNEQMPSRTMEFLLREANWQKQGGEK